VALPAFDIEASMGAGGRASIVKLSGERLNGLITPRDKVVGFDVTMATFTLPFAPKLTIVEFGMKGSADAEGMTVAVADIQRSKAEAVAAEIESAGGRALAIGVDVTSVESLAAAAKEIAAEAGDVNLLCANAGVLARIGPLADHTVEDWEYTLSVNVLGVVKTVAASKTGPSTQTRFIAGPSGVWTRTVQPAQPPTAHAMFSSSETWQGNEWRFASAAVARSMGSGPQANTSTSARSAGASAAIHASASSVT